MENVDTKMSVRERVLAILRGERPDRLPFIDRIELWHAHHLFHQTLPEAYAGMSLDQVHQDVGIGRQKFYSAYAYRLRGVDMQVFFNGKKILHTSDPDFQLFPAGDAPDFVKRDVPGETVIEFITPHGKLAMAYGVTKDMVAMGGLMPYYKEHLMKGEDDWPAVKYILEKSEFIPCFDALLAEDAKLGANGFIVPVINRAPFQQIMLEYLGEIPLFDALYDSPRLIENLMQLLDEVITRDLEGLADLKMPFVEFGDNVDGMMTNPKLFKTYSLPLYRKYTDMLHAQGKKVGSHTDGDLKPILALLAESGLDVCESISPAPLTPATFDEIWSGWENGPLIWGGIPSILLEASYSEQEFQSYMYRLFETVGNRPIILGIGDMVMGPNLIERVRWIAQMVEKHAIS